MRNITIKSFVTLFLLCVLACQETDVAPEKLTDKDMEVAWSLSNSYLENARTEEINDVDVTVIKYSSSLLYKTNTIFGQYNSISEETITAQSEPGGYVFWYGGSGVKELIQIEMDDDSQEKLGEDNVPFEVIAGDIWALWIPADIYDEDEDENIHLKYDIIYKNNLNEIIRLDPKIQVRHEE